MTYRRILVPVDFSPISTTVAAGAAGWSESWKSELHLAHVWWSGIAPGSTTHHDVAGRISRELGDRLDALAEELVPGRAPQTHLVESSDVATAIHDLAVSVGTDLVVAGAHGRHGLRPFFVGSVSTALARSLPIDFLCVRQSADGPAHTPRRFLVPVDFSAPSRRALERAADVAGAEGTLRLVHVLEDLDRPGYFDLFDLALERPGSDEIREGIRERLAEWAGDVADRVGTVETAVLEGPPPEAIARHAEEWGSDWIVLSSHGRHGLERIFLGSVTERTLLASTLPVLVVPGTERH